MISIVVAMDEQGLIGNNGAIPWTCPMDLQHFKTLTLHHDVIMGRKTYEGLPNILLERNIHVATRSKAYRSKGVHLCYNVDELLAEWKAKQEVLYVCGGADIYAQAIPYADEYWISYIHGTYAGDTWFPAIARTMFRCVSRKECEGFTLMHYVYIEQ